MVKFSCELYLGAHQIHLQNSFNVQLDDYPFYLCEFCYYSSCPGAKIIVWSRHVCHFFCPTLEAKIQSNLISLGCCHSSVDSSAPTILPPQVRVPSTPSMLFHLQYLCYICNVKRTKIKQKQAGFGPLKTAENDHSNYICLAMQRLDSANTSWITSVIILKRGRKWHKIFNFKP